MTISPLLKSRNIDVAHLKTSMRCVMTTSANRSSIHPAHCCPLFPISLTSTLLPCSHLQSSHLNLFTNSHNGRKAVPCPQTRSILIAAPAKPHKLHPIAVPHRSHLCCHLNYQQWQVLRIAVNLRHPGLATLPSSPRHTLAPMARPAVWATAVDWALTSDRALGLRPVKLPSVV